MIPAELVKKIQQSPNVADASPYLMFRIRSSVALVNGFRRIDLTKPTAYRSTVVQKSRSLQGSFSDRMIGT